MVQKDIHGPLDANDLLDKVTYKGKKKVEHKSFCYIAFESLRQSAQRSLWIHYSVLVYPKLDDLYLKNSLYGKFHMKHNFYICKMDQSKNLDDFKRITSNHISINHKVENKI